MIFGYRLVAARWMVAITLLAPASALAQDEWDANKGDCETVLKRAKSKQLARLTECVELWLTYRNTSGMTPEQKQGVARGFSVVYYLAGNDDTKDQAYDALRGIGVKRIAKSRLGLGGGKKKSGARKNTPKYYPEVSGGRQKTARKLVKKGLKLHKRKTRKALGLYEKAMKADPNYLKGYYNAACAYALLGDAKSSVELLREIKSRLTRESRNVLSQARKDRDFRKIKRRADFKQATGYASIVLLNGAGPEGTQQTSQLKRVLRNNNRKPDFVGTDENARGRPMVWYKPGFEDVADELKELVDPEKTKLKAIDFNTKIARYDFDIYVIWGMPHKAKLLELPKVDKRAAGAGDEDEPFDPLKAIKDAQGKVEEAGGLLKAPELP